MVCYLIDDDQDDREFFAMAIADVDATITLETADSAVEAIARLKKSFLNPDLIFLDINMPRIDGWECLRELRQIDQLRHTPIVIYSTTENVIRLPQPEGYTAFLTKQPKIADLTVKLKTLLSQLKVLD